MVMFLAFHQHRLQQSQVQQLLHLAVNYETLFLSFYFVIEESHFFHFRSPGTNDVKSSSYWSRCTWYRTCSRTFSTTSRHRISTTGNGSTWSWRSSFKC